VTIRPLLSRGSKIDVVVPGCIVCQNFQSSGYRLWFLHQWISQSNDCGIGLNRVPHEPKGAGDAS